MADYDAALSRLGAVSADLYLERCAQHLAGGEVQPALDGLREARTRLGIVLSIERTALDIEVRAGRFDDALDRLDEVETELAAGVLWLELRGNVLRAAGREMEALAAYTAALDALDGLPGERRPTAAHQALEGRLRAALRTSVGAR